MSFTFSQDLLRPVPPENYSQGSQSFYDSQPPTQPLSLDSVMCPQGSGRGRGRGFTRYPSCPEVGRQTNRWLFSRAQEQKNNGGREIGESLKDLSMRVEDIPLKISKMLEEVINYLDSQSEGKIVVKDSEMGALEKSTKEHVEKSNAIANNLKGVFRNISKLRESVENSLNDYEDEMGEITESVLNLSSVVNQHNLTLKKILCELKELNTGGLLNSDLNSDASFYASRPQRSGQCVRQARLPVMPIQVVPVPFQPNEGGAFMRDSGTATTSTRVAEVGGIRPLGQEPGSRSVRRWLISPQVNPLCKPLSILEIESDTDSDMESDSD